MKCAQWLPECAVRSPLPWQVWPDVRRSGVISAIEGRYPPPAQRRNEHPKLRAFDARWTRSCPSRLGRCALHPSRMPIPHTYTPRVLKPRPALIHPPSPPEQAHPRLPWRPCARLTSSQLVIFELIDVF